MKAARLCAFALAESGRLSPIQSEFESLDRINEVYVRMKKGQIAGRAVIRPSADSPQERVGGETAAEKVRRRRYLL